MGFECNQPNSNHSQNAANHNYTAAHLLSNECSDGQANEDEYTCYDYYMDQGYMADQSRGWPSGSATTTTATTTASTTTPTTTQPATAATATLAATTTPTVLVTTALTHAAATIHASPAATLNILHTTTTTMTTTTMTTTINGLVVLAVLPARRVLSNLAVMRSPCLRVPCNAQATANPRVLAAAPTTPAGRVAKPRCATESAAAAQQLWQPHHKNGGNVCNRIAQSG